MKEEENLYQKEHIKALHYPEVVRLRPNMYIGSIDNRGFLHLLKGVLYDAIHCYQASNICIGIKSPQSLKFKFKPHCPVMNKWALHKFDSSNSPFGIGLETLNALSSSFKIKLLAASSNTILQEDFKKGKLLQENTLTNFLNCDEMEVECKLDSSIWGDLFALNSIFILDEIKCFAYLNRNIQFEVNYIDHNKPCRIIYQFRNGLQDQLSLEQRNGLGKSIFETSIKTSLEDFNLEIAFAFREYSVDEPILKSYVNNYYTHENGTHVDALLKGLTYGVMRYFKKQQVTHYKISEKGIKDHLVAFLHIQLHEPTFVGCVKNKLANPEILEPIANLVADVLFQKMDSNSEATQLLIRKFEI